MICHFFQMQIIYICPVCTFTRCHGHTTYQDWPSRRYWSMARSSHRTCSFKKCVLKNFAKFTGKHLCQSLFFKKETLAQVFSCEFGKIFKNTFSTEHLWETAFVWQHSQHYSSSIMQLHLILTAKVWNIFKSWSCSNYLWLD